MGEAQVCLSHERGAARDPRSRCHAAMRPQRRTTCMRSGPTYRGAHELHR